MISDEVNTSRIMKACSCKHKNNVRYMLPSVRIHGRLTCEIRYLLENKRSLFVVKTNPKP